jgi:hypothetical protein
MSLHRCVAKCLQNTASTKICDVEFCYAVLEVLFLCVWSMALVISEYEELASAIRLKSALSGRALAVH